MAEEWQARDSKPLQRRRRDLAHRDNRNSIEVRDDGAQRRQASIHFLSSWGSIRVKVARVVRMPRERIPQHRLFCQPEFAKSAPHDRCRRFAPWQRTRRQAGRRRQTGDGSSHDEFFVGESDATIMATLIRWRLPNEHQFGLAPEVRQQTFAAAGRSVGRCVHRIAFGPGVENIWRRIRAQQFKQSVHTEIRQVASWGISASRDDSAPIFFRACSTILSVAW